MEGLGRSIQLNEAELRHYSRHIMLPHIGVEGQQKLKAARVLVIGAGGLGCPVLQYLAAAGVGTIGIVDDDVVEESNLQRQVLYGMSTLGQPKAQAAAERLADINPHIRVVAHATRLTAGNARDIVRDYDIVVDGSDNFPTRYLANDTCVLLGKPLVFGSIFQFEGQVSVFNYCGGPTYRCLYPEPPAPGEVPSCAEAGVFGVLPGIIGSLQASETLKIITGVGEVLSGKLLLFNALTLATQTLSFQRDEQSAAVTHLINYEQFCGMSAQGSLPTITASEVRQKQQQGEQVHIVDVREPREYAAGNIGGQLIPLGTIEQHIHAIPTSGCVVVHCHSGARSAQAVALLQQRGFANVYNLQGGIQEWWQTATPTPSV